MRDRLTPFYDSLACLKYYDEADPQTRKRLLARVKKNQKKYHKIARCSPANHQHKFHLVEAERARIRGKTTVACGMYDSAIKGAEKNGFPQDAALAAEDAAEYYLQLNWLEQALSYAQDSLIYYEKWGAFAKLYAVRKKFQHQGLNV